MTLEEAAALLGIAPNTVWRYAQAGYLENQTPYNPVLRRQHKATFRRADVERLRTHPPARKPRTPSPGH